METTEKPEATLQTLGSPAFSIGSGTLDEARAAAERHANATGLATVLEYRQGDHRVCLLVIDPAR